MKILLTIFIVFISLKSNGQTYTIKSIIKTGTGSLDTTWQKSGVWDTNYVRRNGVITSMGRGNGRRFFNIESINNLQYILNSKQPVGSYQNNLTLTTTGSGAATLVGATLNIPTPAAGGATVGYTLSVQALTSSPVDAQTIYFGQLPKVPVTVAATSKVYIRKAGTIKAANIYCNSGTAGTAEAWVMSIRLNNTTDTQIASVALANSERVWSNTSLNIPVIVGDYIEIKAVNPTWVTNPLTTILAGYIYIE